MPSAATRTAGRHIARERGAFERKPEPEPRPHYPGGAPLREFLSERSWRAVLTILARLERRRAA